MWLDREQHRQLQAEDMSAGLMDDYDRQAAEIGRPYQARALERDIMARYEEGASLAAGEGLLRGAMDAFDRGAREIGGRWAELGRNLTVRDPQRGEKIAGAVGDVAGRVGEAAGEIAGRAYKESPGGRVLGRLGIGPVETEEEALENLRGGWLLGADEPMLRERFRQFNGRDPTESELAREVMLQESMESLAIGAGEPLKPAGRAARGRPPKEPPGQAPLLAAEERRPRIGEGIFSAREAGEISEAERMRNAGLAEGMFGEPPPPARPPTAEAAAGREPRPVIQMDPKAIRTDPERLQYKLGAGPSGITSTERINAPEWDVNYGGVLLVWKDPADGLTYVVNGHHRLEFALRTGTPVVDVRYIEAATAKQAAKTGALTNIAEGRGTAIDAAKFLRDSKMGPEEVAASGVTITGKMAEEGLALANLGDNLFNATIQGELRLPRAIAIGRGLPDHADQAALMAVIERRGGRVSDDTVEELIRRTNLAAREATSPRQAGLFDELLESEPARNLALEEAELSAWLRGQLGKEKRLFGFVSKETRAEELTAAGNVLVGTENVRRATESARLLELYDRLSGSRGPVSDALNRGARAVAGGADVQAVRTQLITDVRQAVSDTLAGREPPGAAGVRAYPERGPAPAGRPVPEEPPPAPEITAPAPVAAPAPRAVSPPRVRRPPGAPRPVEPAPPARPVVAESPVVVQMGGRRPPPPPPTPPPGPPTAPPPGGLVPTAPGGLVPTGKPPIPAPGGAGGAIPPGAGAPPAGPGLPPPGGFPPPGAGGAAGGTPGQGAAAYNILRAMYSGRRSPLVQTVQQRLDALGREFVRAWTDRGTDLARVQEAGTRAAGGNLPPEEMAAYLARMNTDKAAAVKLRDGFSPILQAARDAGVDQADLSIYLTNRHTIDVAAATGNPSRTFSGGLTAADAQAAINHQAQLLGTGKFAETEIAAGRTADFVRQSWDTLRDAGVITQELHDEMVRRYPYYIPTKILKYMDKPGDPNMLARGASISLSDSGVRKFTLEGTDAAREDPLGSVIGYTHQAERIAAKNEAFNAFIGLRDRLGIQQIIPEVTGNAAHHLQPDEVYLHGFTDGNYRTFVVPRDVEEAIGRVTRLPRLDWLEVPMMLFKAGATSRNPAFLASNSFLDAFTYMARASIREGGPQHAPRVMLELAKGYREAFRGMAAGRYEGRLNELYRRGGGMFGMYQTTPEGRMQTVRELTRRGAFEVKSKGDVLRMLKDIATLKPVEAVGERIEMAPRVAQYNLALARGKQPLEAMIEARTVTIDFEQGGYISKFLNQVIPFFNVDVQSKAQIVRAVREDWRAALATGISLLAVPTVMAEAWNNADPQRKRDYDDVPDYIKSQGIVFMLPGEAPVDERGDRRPPVFIIRAREHTPVVMITREAMRRALGEDPQSWQEFLGSIITSTSPVQGAGAGEVAANLAPLGIGTAAQLYANRDPFTGRMISTKRRDVTASAASKAIAGGLGAVSRATGIGHEPTPSQVEFAIRDLGTGVAGAALAASNLAAGQKGTGRLSEVPVVGGVAGRVIKSEIGARLEKSREAVLSPQTKQLLRENGVDLGLGPSGNTIEGVPLTIQEQADYQQAINEGVESDLRWLIALPQWASMSPELRKRAVNQVVDAVRQQARAGVLGGLGQAEMGRRAVSGSAGR